MKFKCLQKQRISLFEKSSFLHSSICDLVKLQKFYSCRVIPDPYGSASKPQVSSKTGNAINFKGENTIYSPKIWIINKKIF